MGVAFGWEGSFRRIEVFWRTGCIVCAKRGNFCSANGKTRANWTVAATLARFLPRRIRRSDSGDGHVIVNEPKVRPRISGRSNCSCVMETSFAGPIRCRFSSDGQQLEVFSPTRSTKFERKKRQNHRLGRTIGFDRVRDFA